VQYNGDEDVEMNMVLTLLLLLLMMMMIFRRKKRKSVHMTSLVISEVSN